MPGWTLSKDNSAQHKLALTRPDGVALTVDFTSGKARHRTTESGRGAQALAKALGVKKYVALNRHYPHIIDATGGLGQDAWAVASIGCSITIVERHPVVHALLQDALARAMHDANTKPIAERLQLVHDDAVNALSEHCGSATHAVYLDPMYPERKKTARSKKGIQFLHALLGTPSDDNSALLLAALQSGVSRVAVKRPKGAPVLSGSEYFSGQQTLINTPNTRYDVYHCRADATEC